MKEIGLDTPTSEVVGDMRDAQRVIQKIGFPAVIRPSFTLGGAGGGIVYNNEEYEEIVQRGLDLSPVHEVLIEESVLGGKNSKWK
jgi:carbamoyl-phosphate synthase large subunit